MKATKKSDKAGIKRRKAPSGPIKKSPAAKKMPQKTRDAQKEEDNPLVPCSKTVEYYTDQSDYFKLDQKYSSCGFATRAIHAGNQPDEINGGVAPVINLSTTYAQVSPGVPSSCFDYARCGNPTRLALERNLAAMERASFAFALNSGMSATVSVMHLLKHGDHVLCIDDVYGGTQRYLRQILQPNSGVDVTMVDMSNSADVMNAMLPNTRLLWLETPTNPTLKCFDISAISEVCKQKGVIFVVDSTFMSPALQNALVLGADIVVHSLTKYIGGHSDVVAGSICLNDKALYDRLFFIIKSLGTGISPFDAWVALRGSKTLEIRVEKAMANAEIIAKHLQKHPKVLNAIYPGLKSHPQHTIAKKNVCKGNGGSGMISFYIKGDILAAERFLKSLQLITLAESLGGVESLIESPALMTHGSVPQAQRAALGIADNFIRLSVGIENVEDLISDLDNAFAKV